MKLKQLSLLSLLLAALAGFPNSGVALDTDIYLTTPSISRDDSPNVLFIIDNSGSMDTEITSRETYNPATTYSTISGNPGIANGRVYWSTDSDGLPPASNAKSWFSTTKNNCEASKPVLDTSGVYAGVKIVGYRTSNTSWRNLTSSGGSTTDSLYTFVDCKADTGTPPPGGGYVKSSGVAYTNTASEEINWSGLTGGNYLPRLYTSNYMNYWYNSSLIVTKTRLQIAKETLGAIIDANPNMRFGLMIFNRDDASDGTNSGNHGGRLLMKIDSMTDARRTTMKATINSLTASTATPLAETMWEAYRYFGGKGVDYGDNDLSANPKRDITAENPAPSSGSVASTGNYISPFLFGCQQAYVIYMTDGDPTSDTNANTKIAALSGIGTLSGSYLDELAGWLYNHDVITGTVFSDNSRRRVITYTIGFGSGISDDGKTLLQSTATRGGGLYRTADDADALTAAFQANLVDIMAKTSSFAAPSLSVNAFNRLYNRDEVYLALFKPSGTMGWDGNIKKFGLCKNTTLPPPACLYGEVVDKNGVGAMDPVSQRLKDSAISFWGTTSDGGTVTAGGAGAQVPAPNLRQVYTYRGAYSTTPMALTQIQAVAGNSIFDAAVTDPTILGLTASGDSAVDTTNVTDLLSWMLGRDSYDNNNNGSKTDVRWAFGDPIHSRPYAVNYGGTDAAPIIKLFVGTNDGVVHMINDFNGKEEWAFVPQELLNKQYAVAQDIDGDHIYGMDGTPSVWIQDNNNNGIIEPANDAGHKDKIYMFIGMRRGGNNIYAFDVTPPTTLADQTATFVPKLLWVIRGGGGTSGVGDPDYLKLGQTWSRPAVARIRFGCSTGEAKCIDTTENDSFTKTVLIFAGGYDPHQDTDVAPGGDIMGNAIYIVDPETGKRLWWASNTGSGATLALSKMDFSIPSDLTLIDSDGDRSIDRIYVGDMGGQLWRIDLSSALKLNSNGNTDSVTKGFRFADIACTAGTRPLCTGTAAQDRRRFFYPPDVTQVDDALYEDLVQSKYQLLTIATGNREDPLDLLTVSLTPAEAVHNRIYAFRDYNIKNLTAVTSTLPSAALTENELYDATSNALQPTTAQPYGNPTAIAAIKLKQGWFVTLQNTGTPAFVGEKSLAETTIFGRKLYVTTFTPTNVGTIDNQCSANEGTAKIYGLDMLSAAAVFDYDGDKTLTTEERGKISGGGIASEVVPIIREGGVTTLFGTGGGAQQPGIGTVVCNSYATCAGSLPRFKTFWYEE